MTKIEEVARAIQGEVREPWPDDERESRAFFERLARAAVEAMRDPTENMINESYHDFDLVPLLVWQAMIDAALAEK